MELTNRKITIFLIINFILALGGVILSFNHDTSGAGTKVTDAIWLEDHIYDASGGVQTEAFKCVWKDASATALTLANQAATVTWTDLDLTAYTSANAKMAYVQIELIVDTATKDYYVGLRKNGVAPDHWSVLRVNQGNANAADIHSMNVWVGLDSDEICEYTVFVEAGGQCDVTIDVLAYME